MSEVKTGQYALSEKGMLKVKAMQEAVCGATRKDLRERSRMKRLKEKDNNRSRYPSSL